jgi:hypothetical protein
MIGHNLLRFTKGFAFLPTDTETEGLNTFYSRPWQIAWGLCDAKGNLAWVKDRYIWWSDLNISKEAAIKTRFDYGTYKAKALPAADVLTEYRADRDNPEYRTLWQNGLGLDVYAIATWERACGVASPDTSYTRRSIDLNALIKAVAKGWTPPPANLDPDAFLAWQYAAIEWREKGLKSNLTDAGKARKIEHDYSGTHNAVNDISLTAKVFGAVVFELEV